MPPVVAESVRLPVAVDDKATTSAGVPVVVDVLANDVGNGLIIKSFGAGVGGSVALNSTKTSLLYNPESGFANNTDTFSYSISDSQGNSASATVTVTILPLAHSCKDQYNVRVDRGLVIFSVNDVCRKGQLLRIESDGRHCTRPFDNNGQAEFKTVRNGQNTLTFFASDNTPVVVNIPEANWSEGRHDITRITIRWENPVDLDLHVLEPRSSHFGSGHIWADQPNLDYHHGKGSLILANDGISGGCLEESYLVDLALLQHPGILRVAVDFAARSKALSEKTCGNGTYAKTGYTILEQHGNALSKKSSRIFSPWACGKKTPIEFVLREVWAVNVR